MYLDVPFAMKGLTLPEYYESCHVQMYIVVPFISNIALFFASSFQVSYMLLMVSGLETKQVHICR